MRASWLVPALLLLAAAGGATGWTLARRPGLLGGEPRVPRPDPLEAALRGYERDGPAALTSHRAALERAAREGPAEARAEADLLLVLEGRGGAEALDGVALRHPGSHAAARARWLAAQSAPEGALRRERLDDFARRWPGAWVLRRAERHAGGPGASDR